MPIVEVSVVPVGTGDTSVSRYVTAALEVVKESGLDYDVNPMGTCLQGDWDKVFSAIRTIHERLVQMGCQRIVTTIKVDDRRDEPMPMRNKVSRVTGKPGT
jgi:uncharacterized protein (TIGR00106 family)